jgi:hypothetical protein
VAEGGGDRRLAAPPPAIARVAEGRQRLGEVATALLAGILVQGARKQAAMPSTATAGTGRLVTPAVTS